MDEILKSEIFLVADCKKEGVSMQEFAGLFRQIHGYCFKLSNYGYSSLRTLLNDMNDLVELKTVNGQEMIQCKSPSRHHVQVSNENNSSQAKQQTCGLSRVPLPSTGPPPGPAVQERGQARRASQQNLVKVNSTNSATGKKSKEASKLKCSLPSKNIDPAVSHRNSPQPMKSGFSLNTKSAIINKSTKKQTSAISKPPNSNPVHARPSGNVGIAAVAAKASNVTKARVESNSKFSNPKSERNLTSMQNVRSSNTRTVESLAFSATTGPGIRPNVSYASVCSGKTQFNHHGQQYTPSNRTFNEDTKVNSTTATQTYSRAEPRASIQSSAIIKENIQVLLNQHVNGLSVFQLQKMYLFRFQQPLKCKGPATVKQLLLELKDEVKLEGVGVQMLVFPIHAENNPTADAYGDHDSALQGTCSLLITKDFQKEGKPHSSDCWKTQNYKLQEVAQLPLRDDQILTSGHQQMDIMEGHTTKVVQIKHKPSTLHKRQTVESIPVKVDYVEFSREYLPVPAPDAIVLPNYINEKSQLEMPSSVQMHKQMCKSHGQGTFLSIPIETTTNNGPSQNAFQDSSVSQVILHSSGFSFVMNQPMTRPHNKSSEMDLVDTTSSFAKQNTPYHSNNMLKGHEHSEQILSKANSNMLFWDTKQHQLSSLQVETTEHLLLQPHNLMNTKQSHGQEESPALQPTGDFQITNNCNITEHPPSHSRESPQTKTVPVQTEKSSSIQKPSSQNGKTVEKAISSTSEEKATNSQFISTVNTLSSLASNEKTPDAQTKNVIEKTLQEEASISPCSNDLGKASVHDLYVHGTKQAAQMSSDVHKTVNICTSKAQKNKITPPTMQPDEFITAKTSLSSSKPREEIVDPTKNITKTSVTETELQSRESGSQQRDVNTWQTSQEQVCCIL